MVEQQRKNETFINTLVDEWGINDISDFEENESIKEYKPKLYLNDNKKYGYFYLNTSTELIDCIKCKVSKHNPVYAKDTEIQKETPIMWTAYLSKKPEKVNIPQLHIVNFPKGYYFDLDKGHLLAKEFMQYIGSNIEEIKPFFYKNKQSNIIYQFKNVNRNVDGEYGQSLFEARVVKEIEENNSNVYYQIEPVFYDKKDKIPIGTRIIAFRDADSKSDFNSDKKNIRVPFHVFVPNYDTFTSSEKRRNFYQNGF